MKVKSVSAKIERISYSLDREEIETALVNFIKQTPFKLNKRIEVEWDCDQENRPVSAVVTFIYEQEEQEITIITGGVIHEKSN